MTPNFPFTGHKNMTYTTNSCSIKKVETGNYKAYILFFTTEKESHYLQHKGSDHFPVQKQSHIHQTVLTSCLPGHSVLKAMNRDELAICPPSPSIICISPQPVSIQTGKQLLQNFVASITYKNIYQPVSAPLPKLKIPGSHWENSQPNQQSKNGRKDRVQPLGWTSGSVTDQLCDQVKQVTSFP